MSGGARVSPGYSARSELIAGVIGIQRGYPDGKLRKDAAFCIFATAGN